MTSAGLGYYLAGHVPFLAYLTQKITATIIGLLVGIPAGWLIARVRLVPAWLAHFRHLVDLLNPHTAGGIGEHTQQLAEINRKLDDLSGQS